MNNLRPTWQSPNNTGKAVKCTTCWRNKLHYLFFLDPCGWLPI